MGLPAVQGAIQQQTQRQLSGFENWKVRVLPSAEQEVMEPLQCDSQPLQGSMAAGGHV